MYKILSVIGTRPEAIKMAPVIKALERYPTIFESVICTTGQHREMLKQTLDVFGLNPDYELDIMRPNQDLFDVTANSLLGLRDVLKAVEPDWVLVQGDTTTALVASMGAFYTNARVGHIEAGLRSYQNRSPFPEEMNRRMIDLLADQYFAPTAASHGNLVREGVADNRITITGNTAIDALLWIVEEVQNLETPIPELRHVDFSKRTILVTAHRRESFGKGLESICEAILHIAHRYPDFNIIYPVHLNPNVQQVVRRILGNTPNVHLIDPQPYDRLVWLMTRARLVLTDSGGIQEEAPALNKPVLVMREVTERQEGIEAGCARLVGVDRDSIIRHVRDTMEDGFLYLDMANAPNPYGDGRAADRIVTALIQQQTASTLRSVRRPASARKQRMVAR
jgi:UDP-N-acetylglucosamine 2-epimerase (non-hydrolysing)